MRNFKARLKLNEFFDFEAFTYSEDMKCYFAEEIADLGLTNVEIAFVEGALSKISFTKNDIRYEMVLSFIKW